jgi:hypothetical protein
MTYADVCWRMLTSADVCWRIQVAQTWSRDQGVATARRTQGKVPKVHSIQQDCIAQEKGHREKAAMAALLWRKRYEIVGLTKHRDHTRARVSVHDSCQVQHKEDVFAIHEGMEEHFPGKASYPKVHGSFTELLFERKGKNIPFFLFQLILVFYLISIPRSKVTHTGSMYIRTL